MHYIGRTCLKLNSSVSCFLDVRSRCSRQPCLVSNSILAYRPGWEQAGKSRFFACFSLPGSERRLHAQGPAQSFGTSQMFR